MPHPFPTRRTPSAERSGSLLASRSHLPLAAAALALGNLLAAASLQAQGYTLLGDVQSARPTANGVLLHAANGDVLIESVTGVGARVRARMGGGTFAAPTSLASGDAAVALAPARVRDAGDTVVVDVAEGVELRATRHPLRITARDAAGHVLLQESDGAGAYEGRRVHYVRDLPGTRYYALGEQPTGMLRNGNVAPFWNTDHFGYAPGDVPIYSSMPFYIGVLDGVAHGVLYDNPYRGEMDFADRLPGSLGYNADGAPDGGELRYYVIPGPGVDSVVARYTRLTGRMPLPPRWSLGYQQSRYSYTPDTMLMNVANELRRRDIPADVLYLDIGYMNGYRVFTWSPTAFPHPKALLDSLARIGFRVVTIVDPGVKVDSAYGVYLEGLRRHMYATVPGGQPALGIVWPGLAAFPDFTRADVRAWWGDRQKALLDSGVAGIWNDMNEPASFSGLLKPNGEVASYNGKTLSELAQFQADGHPGPSVEYHNEYGTLMARASYDGQRRARPDARPFVITRAGYPGVQRYSTMWTGDNSSTWDHLKLSLSMVLSLGLTGEPFAGSDIGGFAGNPSAELYTRWLQSATLVPLFRTHSTIDVPRREPWVYGPRYEAANRATIRLRYRLIPAVYTAFYEHTRNGAPVVRPVFWESVTDTTALGVGDEYFLGDHLLAAPVVDSGGSTRSVYLPAGRWYRVGSDSAYAGAARVTVPAPLLGAGDTTGLAALPLFARAGAVIPMQAVRSHEGGAKPDTLELHVWPAASAAVTSTLYEDAGDGYAYEHGASRVTTFTTTGTAAVDLTIARAGSYAGARTFIVTVHAVGRPRSVQVDGRSVTPRYDTGARTATFAIPSTTRRVVVTP